MWVNGKRFACQMTTACMNGGGVFISQVNDSYVKWIVHMPSDGFVYEWWMIHMSINGFMCEWRSCIHVSSELFICQVNYSYVKRRVRVWREVMYSYVNWIIHIWSELFMCQVTSSCVNGGDVFIFQVNDSYVKWIVHMSSDGFVCEGRWRVHMWEGSPVLFSHMNWSLRINTWISLCLT